MSKLVHSVFFFLICFPVSVIADTETVNKTTSIDTFSIMNVLNMVMGLVVVIALILGLAWVLRKYGRLPNNNLVDMKVLGGLSLGTREKAVLIEVDNKRILIGVAPGHIQTLHVLDGSSSASFDSKLEKAMENQN